MIENSRFNNALAGAAGGVVGEITAMKYADTQLSKLNYTPTEAEMQSIKDKTIALSQTTGAIVGGLVSGEVDGVIAGSVTGRNAAENNFFQHFIMPALSGIATAGRIIGNVVKIGGKEATKQTVKQGAKEVAKQGVKQGVKEVAKQGVKVELKDTQHLHKRQIESGVSSEAVQDAIKNPLQITAIRYDAKGLPSYKVIGRYATVAINPDNGNIVTTHKTSSSIVNKLTKK